MSGVTPNADAQRRSLLDPFQACVGILDDAAGCGGAGRRPGMRSIPGNLIFRVLPKVILKKVTETPFQTLDLRGARARSKPIPHRRRQEGEFRKFAAHTRYGVCMYTDFFLFFSFLF